MKLINSEVGIFSDPHYGIHRNSEVWHKIALDHAKWAVEQFKQRGIKDIIIPGDIFHDRNDIAVNTLHVVTEIFNCFKDFNLIITVGNHDAFYRDKSDINSISIFSGWTNITVVDKLAVETFFNRKIAFCPWGQDLKDVPNCDIIFGHFAINSFKMNSYKVCVDGSKPSDLTNRAPLTITGHFHHKETRKYDKGKIVYIGCPYQQDWGDYESSKGLYVLDLDKLDLEFIENKFSPQYQKLYYSELADGKYTIDFLKKALKGNIVKFYIDRALEAEAVDAIIRKLISIKPVEFTIEYDYTEASKLDVEEANTKNFNVNVETSIAEFIDLLEINNRDKVKTYVNELYHKATSEL